MSKIMVEPHSRKDIENYAAKIKDLLGMKNTLYVPIIRVAELIIPRIDSSFNCYPVYNEEMPQKYAEYRPKTNELVVRQDVYDAVCKDDTRHRFTIAHELGHYFLHDDVSFSRCQDDVEIPKYRDPEWQQVLFFAKLVEFQKLLFKIIFNIVAMGMLLKHKQPFTQTSVRAADSAFVIVRVAVKE